MKAKPVFGRLFLEYKRLLKLNEYKKPKLRFLTSL